MEQEGVRPSTHQCNDVVAVITCPSRTAAFHLFRTLRAYPLCHIYFSITPKMVRWLGEHDPRTIRSSTRSTNKFCPVSLSSSSCTCHARRSKPVIASLSRLPACGILVISVFQEIELSCAVFVDFFFFKHNVQRHGIQEPCIEIMRITHYPR